MKNTKPVMVRMPPELYERLRDAAERTMVTPSALARILIKQQLDSWDQAREEPQSSPRPAPEQARPQLSRQQRRAMEREAKKQQR
jgi:hypothetical protein